MEYLNADGGVYPPAPKATSRLHRLEAYLAMDPGNQALLSDAFDAAIWCGAWDRAGFHLKHGQAIATDPLAWSLKEGDFFLAQRKFDDARRVLSSLQEQEAPPDFKWVLLHNLAYIDFAASDFVACAARLAERVEPAAPADYAHVWVDVLPIVRRSVQTLWLRCLHQSGELKRAFDWAASFDRLDQLDPSAAAVASLVAIDIGNLEAARSWSSTGLLDGDETSATSASLPVELFITLSTLSLASGDSGQSTRFADQALGVSPNDGRAWSVRGFATLRSEDHVTARENFKNALRSIPAHIGTWHGLAWTQVLQGDLPAAEASFRYAITLDRNFSESHGGLAVALVLQKNLQEARFHVGRALKLDDENLSGRYAQALMDGESGDTETIKRLARRILAGRREVLDEVLSRLASES